MAALLRRRQLNSGVQPTVGEKVFYIATLFGGFARGVRHHAEHRTLQTLRAERNHASKNQDGQEEKYCANNPLDAVEGGKRLRRPSRFRRILKAERRDAAEVAQIQLDGEH